MAYQVALANSAKADANQIYGLIIERAPLRGPEWFEELIDCLYSLENLPYRCPLAREAGQTKREIRCLLFGKRRNANAFSMKSMRPGRPSGCFISGMDL